MRFLLLILLAFGAAPLAAQIPDTMFLSAARADALTGLYVLDDGRVVHVLDLRDQIGGRPVLSVTEYASGRIRALYPMDSVRFEAGNAWFRHDSLEYTLRFDESARPAAGLVWEEDGRTIGGRRAPLVEREVEIQSGELTLAGSLVLPPGPGPHPAVVMVPGSGPLTRRTPRYWGDLLAYHGVAVLAADKRGTGGSGGNWNGLGHADWARDVEAELDFLHTQPGIDGSRLGLTGSSEAGFVVPVVAARRSDVSFIVCRVCSVLPHPEAVLDMQRNFLTRDGMADSNVAKALELLDRAMRYALDRTGYDSLVAFAAQGDGAPWRAVFTPQEIPARDAGYWDGYRNLMEVDPREYYARLTIPVLAILGERDDRVLVDKHQAAFDSLARAGRDITVWVIPNASHGLTLSEPGLGQVGYPPGMHDRIARWVTEHAGVGMR
jgi:dipeptidyl aminopeptidase/acylaminoacyl peptidase